MYIKAVKRNIIYSYIILLLYSLCFLSQENTEVNNYLSKLKKVQSDTAKINIYSNLTEVCDLEEIPTYAEECLRISNTSLQKYTDNKTLLEIILQRNKALNNLAVYYYEKNNFKESLKLWEALNHSYDSLLKNYPDNKRILLYLTDILNNLASVYESIGKYDKSITLYYKGLKYAEMLNDSILISRISNNIGFMYKQINDLDNALKFYQKSLKIKENLNDSSGIAIILNNIAQVYLIKREEEKAEWCFLRSNKISQLINNSEMIALTAANLGKTYTNTLEFDKAKTYLWKALNLYEQLEKEAEVGNVYLDIANLFFNIYANSKKFSYLDSALIYLNKSELIGIKLKDNKLLLHVYKLISEVYNSKKNCDKAYFYHRKEDSLKNIINLFENQKTSFKQELEYEYDKILFKNKSEYEKNILLAKEKNQRQQLQLIFSIIGLIATLIFSIAIIITLRKVSQKNKIIQSQKLEVEQQKEIIEKKQKDILDSIHYSQLIQKSILPHRSDIWKVLPQSFVLYKPKDIVAGDFYWFYIKEDYCFIAVADCTGHGVPGAFMSILNNDKLNEAINLTDDTGHLLYLVNNSVKKTLKQINDNSLTKDGMDIIILKIPYKILHNDYQSIEVEFSGANRPLYVFRNNENTIEEHKTNKFSIGGFTDSNQKFEKFSIVLNKNDVVYLTTDGYIDQFGGEKNKKLMSSGFKKLLLSIGALHYQQQKRELLSFFEQWKGNNEQIDDVCIIGIKI